MKKFNTYYIKMQLRESQNASAIYAIHVPEDITEEEVKKTVIFAERCASDLFPSRDVFFRELFRTEKEWKDVLQSYQTFYGPGYDTVYHSNYCKNGLDRFLMYIRNYCGWGVEKVNINFHCKWDK